MLHNHSEMCGPLNVFLSILYCILYLLLLLLTPNRKYTNQSFIYLSFIHKQAASCLIWFQQHVRFFLQCVSKERKKPCFLYLHSTDCYWKDKDRQIIIRPSFFAQTLRKKLSYKRASFTAENILSKNIWAT